LTQEKTVSLAPVKADLDFISLNAALTEMRKEPGITGYILRSDTSAAADLAESGKIIDYALLTSQATDLCRVLAQNFTVGTVDSSVVEGKNVKILCASVRGMQVSVFMQKEIDHSRILKRIVDEKLNAQG
jgi:predicted regulator of Ras-like GTPase activity (Roadblock/LC7/MglB family)